MRRPSTVTVPADGRSMPVIMFMIVDLPLPDGPTIATISPLSIARSTPRGARLEQFTGFLFTACVIGGVAWWLVDSAGPAWAVYPTVSAAAFFGIGALGYLLTAVISPEH
jgi:hypothetical protein